jgi:hypothetical protein
MEGPSLNRADKKAINSIIKGFAEAASIKVDDIKMPQVCKSFLNHVIKGAENVAEEELVSSQNTGVLKVNSTEQESNLPATTVARIKDEAEIEVETSSPDSGGL